LQPAIDAQLQNRQFAALQLGKFYGVASLIRIGALHL